MVFAQLLLLTGDPTVQRPSLILGLNGTSVAHRLVVLGNGLARNCCAFTPSSFLRKFVDRVGHDPGDLSDPVFVALQVLHLAIEDLPSELARLLQHDAAIFRIRVIAEIAPSSTKRLPLALTSIANGYECF